MGNKRYLFFIALVLFISVSFIGCDSDSSSTKAECPCDFSLAFWTNPTWSLNMQEGRLFNECVDSTAVPVTMLAGGDSIGALNCNAVLDAEESCSSVITCFAVQFEAIEIQGEIERDLTDEQVEVCRDQLRQIAGELGIDCQDQ